MVLSLIGGRLLQLQGLDRSAYADSAQNQRLHTVTLIAHRGRDHRPRRAPDRRDRRARDVVADPPQVDRPDAAAAALCAGPAPHARQADHRQLTVPGSQYALLAPTPVTPAVGEPVLGLKSRGSRPPTPRSGIYPDGSLASNVVGFVAADGTGLGGLELS